MARKRLTDVDLWTQDWFRALPQELKIHFLYIKDAVDACGVWQIDAAKFQFDTGVRLQLVDFVKAANGHGVNELIPDEGKKRFEILPGGKHLWIVGFCTFQYSSGIQYPPILLRQPTDAWKKPQRPHKPIYDALTKVPSWGLLEKVKAQYLALGFVEYQWDDINQRPVNYDKQASIVKKQSAHGIPPASTDVEAYGREIGLPAVEVSQFMDHFTSNGWKVGGRTPMVDWRASLRNWQRNHARFNPAAHKTPRKLNTAWQQQLQGGTQPA